MSPEQLIDRIALRVPEPPRATIREELAEAARELCEQADVWVIDGPIIYGAATDFPFLAAGQAVPLRIIELQLEGRPVTQGGWFSQPSPGEVVFHRSPGVDTVNGRLAVKPRAGELPPPEVLRDHAQALIDGTVGRLLMLPHAWRDAELALMHQRRFLDAIAQARQRSRLGYARGGARVKPRRFI